MLTQDGHPSILEEVLDKFLSEIYGVKPEQLTMEFIHEMKKKMRAYDLDHGRNKDVKVSELASAEFYGAPTLFSLTRRVDKPTEMPAYPPKLLRKWAQEVLITGPTPC